jgi:1,4-alpha-glucan branching enzyme
LGFPSPGLWDEVLNTDSEIYGGSGVGNAGRVAVKKVPHGKWAFSVSLRLPPLGVVVFRPAK